MQDLLEQIALLLGMHDGDGCGCFFSSLIFLLHVLFLSLNERTIARVSRTSVVCYLSCCSQHADINTLVPKHGSSLALTPALLFSSSLLLLMRRLTGV